MCIRDRTQLVLDGDLTPEQEAMLKMAHTAATALLGILNGILDFSKIEAGRLELERRPLNIEHLLQSIVSLFSAQIASKGLVLTLNVAADVPRQVLGLSLIHI